MRKWRILDAFSMRLLWKIAYISRVEWPWCLTRGTLHTCQKSPPFATRYVGTITFLSWYNFQVAFMNETDFRSFDSFRKMSLLKITLQFYSTNKISQKKISCTLTSENSNWFMIVHVQAGTCLVMALASLRHIFYTRSTSTGGHLTEKFRSLPVRKAVPTISN